MAVEKAMYEAPVGIDSEEAMEPALEIEIVDPEEVSVSIDGMEIFEFDADDDGLDHNANIAELLEEQALNLISDELLEAYETDLESRAEWEETYYDGLELLGLKIEDRSEPWEGAFGVYHPVLAEAVVKFQAETIVETFPAQGPVKTKVIGAYSKERTESANRVREDMNHMLTDGMPDYRSEHERLLWNLPIAGSAFKKVYFDPSLDRPVAQFIPAEDLIVSYGTSSLESAQRITHRMKRTQNEMRKMQVSGFYRDVELGDPVADNDEVSKRKDELGGYNASQDDRYTLLEIHCDLDIEGFEDTDKEGNPTGIEIPYIVTIEKGTGEVLSIYRNYEEEDDRKRRLNHFSHYNYVPGFGFYGFGLIHLIGGYAKGATSIMRQLVDAGTLSNLPGGFRTRGMRIRGGDTPIAPGEFRDVDVPTGTIRDNIMPLPYKEPSMVLQNMLNTVVDEARRFAAMADVQVSDMQANAAVGSTLAVLERQLKTMTAVQSRVHHAMKGEFKILKRIVAEMSPESYEYDALGDEPMGARRMDYEITDIIPVSDPNASTMAQRVAQYQSLLQLAQQQPEIYDLPRLHRQMIEVLGVKNANELVPDKEDIRPMDPVTENMALLRSKPIKAFAYQDHEAHIQAHMAFAQDPKLQEMLKGDPTAAAKMAAGMEHINDHLAFLYRSQVEEQLGVPLPTYNADEKETLPEDAEIALSRLVAEAGNKLLGKHSQEAQAKQAEQAQKDPVIQMQQKELQLQEGELQRKMKKDEMDHQIKLAQVQIDATRVQSDERKSGFNAGIKLKEAEAKIASEERKTGFKEGMNLKKGG
jgi:hypothetical protein